MKSTSFRVRSVLGRAVLAGGISFGAFAVTATSVAKADFSSDTIPGRWIQPLVPEALPALKYPSYFNDLDKAKQQVWTGRYKIAVQTLSKLKPDEKGADVGTLARLRAEALSGTGEDAAAIKELSNPALADDQKVQVLRAVLLARVGQTADAIASLKAVIKAHPESVVGHYELGRISEVVDDVNTAREQYNWFVAPAQDYLRKWRDQGDKLFTSAEDCTTVGLALDRWATLNSVYQTDSDLNQNILDLFVKAYDVIDRSYWPAHVAAARFYLSHDDAANAEQELKAALKLNPNSEPALALLGTILVEHFAFDNADQVIASIRRENPDSVAAEMVTARNLLRQRQPKQAAVVLGRVLSTQPDLLEARGLLAATEALQLHEDTTKKLLSDVEKLAPNDARAYFEVAEQLGAMRQYPRAAAMYRIAVDRAPWWNEPRNGLGLLYTQSGEEDKAQETLQAAHNVDPFNVSTTNYLRLLDKLKHFGRKESAHFIVVYDKENDPLIPEYFNDYLESVYTEVTGEYRTEPAEKTMIEVFPTHDAFSVRTTGAPWIGTVGASTGRIIALVTPRKGENTWKPFNWAQVLRHEFTHTVTLAATDNRISHWMTEGLAVYEERSGLQWPWVPMMYHAVTHDELFDMDQLTWAFVRPKKPSDRQMAYAQSYWVCTYIEQTYGHEAILKMLNDFKSGGLQDDVFPRVLGRSTPQFFTEFTAWAKQQVAGWGYDKATTEKYEALVDKAEAAIAASKYDEAAKDYEEAGKLRPMDEAPHKKLAGLYLSAKVNQPEKAIPQLKLLHLLDVRDDRFAKRIARLYRDQGDFKNAEAYGLQAVYIDPYDMDAHELLSELCQKANDQPGLAREQRVIPKLTEWLDAQKKK